MDCLREQKLSAYVDKTLNPIEMAMIRDHLIQCDRCRQQYRILKGLENSLRNPVVLPAPPRIRRTVMRQISGDMSYYSSLTALVAAGFLFMVTTLYLVFDFANNSVIKSFENASVRSGGIVSAVIKMISGTFRWLYSVLNTANTFIKTIFKVNPGIEVIALFSMVFSLMLIFLLYFSLQRKGYKQ
jgi:hypothetical protein